jgi:hypothetical protein
MVLSSKVEMKSDFSIGAKNANVHIFAKFRSAKMFVFAQVFAKIFVIAKMFIQISCHLNSLSSFLKFSRKFPFSRKFSYAYVTISDNKFCENTDTKTRNLYFHSTLQFTG